MLSFDRVIDWLIDCTIDCLVDRLDRFRSLSVWSIAGPLDAISNASRNCWFIVGILTDRCSMDRILTDRSIDRSVHWGVDWSLHRLIEWLIGWPFDWSLIACMCEPFIGWLYLLFNRSCPCLADWCIKCSLDRLIVHLISWLIERSTIRFIAWSSM